MLCHKKMLSIRRLAQYADWPIPSYHRATILPMTCPKAK